MGEFMPFSGTCPECSKESDYDIDLRDVLGKVRCPHYVPFEFKNLTFQLKPQCYREMNSNSQMRFVEKSIERALSNSELSNEQRQQIIAEQVAKIEDFNYQLLTTSTEYIATPDGTRVDDPNQIKEFYVSAESSIIRRVKKEIEHYTEVAGLDPMDLKCYHCEHQYQRELVFNYSNFFE